MKRFLAFMTMILIVSLIPFNTNANPPDYDDIGIYDVPSFDVDLTIRFDMEIDVFAPVLQDHYIINSTHLATVNPYFNNISEKNQNDFVYSDIGKHSNSQVLTLSNLSECTIFNELYTEYITKLYWQSNYIMCDLTEVFYYNTFADRTLNDEYLDGVKPKKKRRLSDEQFFRNCSAQS